MLNMLINAIICTILLCIVVLPIYFIYHKFKKYIDRKDFVDEKKDEYAEYDKQFFEELKKKNEEYEKNKK